MCKTVSHSFKTKSCSGSRTGIAIPPLLKPIFSVVVNHHAATIRYLSTHSESTRTIIPIGLYTMNGLWYCPAYCTTAGQIRVFRVDRIQEILEEKPYPMGNY